MSSYLKLDTSLGTYVTVSDADFPFLGGVNANFAIWCRMDSKSVSSVLFEKYDGVQGVKATFNAEANGDLSLEFMVHSDIGIVTSRIEDVPVKLNEWQLYVFARDIFGNNQYISIDAVKHADTSNTDTEFGTQTNTEDFYLGYNDPSTTSPEGKIDIDSFGVYYGLVMTESDIQDIYNRGHGRKMTASTPELDFGLNLDEGTGSVVTDIISSATGTITSDASPFDNVWNTTGGVGVMLPSSIKMYLTSLEPDLEQMNYSQSLGGYISESLLYPETTLTAELGLYGESFTITDATDLIGYSYVSILNEIIEVETISSTSVTVVNRGVNQTIGYYPTGVIVQGVLSPFNDYFNSDRKQYRCYAIKNISTTESAYTISAYFGQISRNEGTTMRLALESPKSQGATGVTTSWTSSMLVDSSLAGVYDDNFYAESYITFEDSPNAGEKKRIQSYTGSTGTFVLADSLPVDYDSDAHTNTINYTIDVSPAQRVKSGTDSPIDTDYITDFSEATSRGVAVQLGNVKESGWLLPGEIIYAWVEREIGKSSVSYDNNSFVLNIDFSKEFEGN